MVDLTDAWYPPVDADGNIDWSAIPPRDPKLGFYKNAEEKAAHESHDLKLLTELRKHEEAKAAQEEKRLQRDLVKRGYAPDASTAPRQLVGRVLSGVALHAIEWLWTGWIPKGVSPCSRARLGQARARCWRTLGRV